MDIVFSNRVSAKIFKQCARAIVEEKQYSETPIELRKKIEDCFDTYVDQHAIVMRGTEKFQMPPAQ
jgi:hypothetical protein